MLLHYRVRPLLAFDGGALPAKKATEVQRRAKRDAARAQGAPVTTRGLARGRAPGLLRRGRRHARDGGAALRRGEGALGRPRRLFGGALRGRRAARAAARSGQCDGVISEDSDNLPYGVPRTLFKLDANGQAKEIALRDLYDAPEGVNAISIRGWTHDMFALMLHVGLRLRGVGGRRRREEGPRVGGPVPGF